MQICQYSVSYPSVSLQLFLLRFPQNTSGKHLQRDLPPTFVQMSATRPNEPCQEWDGVFTPHASPGAAVVEAVS